MAGSVWAHKSSCRAPAACVSERGMGARAQQRRRCAHVVVMQHHLQRCCAHHAGAVHTRPLIRRRVESCNIALPPARAACGRQLNGRSAHCRPAVPPPSPQPRELHSPHPSVPEPHMPSACATASRPPEPALLALRALTLSQARLSSHRDLLRGADTQLAPAHATAPALPPQRQRPAAASHSPCRRCACNAVAATIAARQRTERAARRLTLLRL